MTKQMKNKQIYYQRNYAFTCNLLLMQNFKLAYLLLSDAVESLWEQAQTPSSF